MTARLHPDDLAALADMIAERVIARLAETPERNPGVPPHADRARCPEDEPGAVERLLTAAEVAERYGVTAEWVRDRASDLGVIRIGNGPRPRLRFDPERVAEALSGRSESEASRASETRAVEPSPARTRARCAGTALDSLPVREIQPRRSPRNRGGAAGTARPTATER